MTDMSNFPERRAWSYARSRCMNPKNEKYAIYGGRGIAMSLEWNTFAAFYRDMGPKPSPKPCVPWYQALAAHAAIQGMFVGLITGSAVLGVGETIAHGFIDYIKCQGWISFNTDQALHLCCKIIWCASVILMARP